MGFVPRRPPTKRNGRLSGRTSHRADSKLVKAQVTLTATPVDWVRSLSERELEGAKFLGVDDRVRQRKTP
jgi:hypothetical protein